MSDISDISPAQAICAVFLVYVRDSDFGYLVDNDLEGFGDENPDDVRCDFNDAIEYTLCELGVNCSAENVGEAGNIVLEWLTDLACYFEETTALESARLHEPILPPVPLSSRASP